MTVLTPQGMVCAARGRSGLSSDVWASAFGHPMIQVCTCIFEESHALKSLFTISWKPKPFVNNFFVWLPLFGWLGAFSHRPSTNFYSSRPEHARFELSTLWFQFFFGKWVKTGNIFGCWWFSPCTKSPRKSLHSLSKIRWISTHPGQGDCTCWSREVGSER